jgi:hypothetical protein
VLQVPAERVGIAASQDAGAAHCVVSGAWVPTVINLRFSTTASGGAVAVGGTRPIAKNVV